MHASQRFAVPVTLIALALAGCGGSSGNGSGFLGTGTGGGLGTFTQKNLTSNVAGRAAVTDPKLVNPWGISFLPGNPFWISDNGTGVSTLYNGSGVNQGLVVQIPAAAGATNGPVSGQLANNTTDFSLGASGPAAFIFVNEDGVISGWNGGLNAIAKSDRSATNAVYKGVAMASNAGANFLYVANFNSNRIDVFDKNFTLVKSFTDTGVLAGFAPFGIANIGGMLYVTFAKQNSAKHDDVKGAGNGYVDVFNSDGTLAKRLISQGQLNSPWAVVLAPSGFGKVGGDLLVGNFGDGRINAYNINTGAFIGALNNSSGNALAIDGLWGLIFGGGGTGASNTLYFTAGPDKEANGLFGSISAN